LNKDPDPKHGQTVKNLSPENLSVSFTKMAKTLKAFREQNQPRRMKASQGDGREACRQQDGQRNIGS